MRHWLKLVAFAVVSSTALAAQAEPDEGAKLVARELMAQGRAQREKRDLQGALTSFSKAHAIMHVPTTLLEAARARADLGLLLEAQQLLRELRDAPPKLGEPPAFARARKAAEQLGTDLETRIPSLSVDLLGSPAPAATTLWIDDVARPDCVSSCRVNPGKHVVVARAPAAQAEEQVAVAEREAQKLELVFSPISRNGSAAAPRGAETTTAAETAEPAPRSAVAPGAPEARISTLTWTLGGVALAGLGAGTVLGLSALDRRNELRQVCAPGCAASDVDEVRRRAVFANVSLGVGVTAAALAVTTYVIGARRPETRDRAARGTGLRLAAAPDPQTRGGWVAVGGSF